MKYLPICLICVVLAIPCLPAAEDSSAAGYILKLKDEIYYELVKVNVIKDGDYLRASAVKVDNPFVVLTTENGEVWIKYSDVVYIKSADQKKK